MVFGIFVLYLVLVWVFGGFSMGSHCRAGGCRFLRYSLTFTNLRVFDALFSLFMIQYCRVLAVVLLSISDEMRLTIPRDRLYKSVQKGSISPLFLVTFTLTRTVALTSV
jgi:hypothetical protein